MNQEMEPSPHSLAYQLAHTPLSADMRASVERTVAQLLMPYLPPSGVVQLRLSLWPDYPWRFATAVVGILFVLPLGVAALSAAIGEISWGGAVCVSVGFGLICSLVIGVNSYEWGEAKQVVSVRFTPAQGLSVQTDSTLMHWYDVQSRSVDFYVNIAQLAAKQLQAQAQSVQQQLDKAVRLTERLDGTADAGALSLPSDTRSS